MNPACSDANPNLQLSRLFTRRSVVVMVMVAYCINLYGLRNCRRIHWIMDDERYYVVV